MADLKAHAEPAHPPNDPSDVARRLGPAGPDVLADIGARVSRARGSALTEALDTIQSLPEPSLQDLAARLADLQREPIGGVDASVLREIRELLVRPSAPLTAGTASALEKVKRAVDRALLAPAEAAAQMLESGRLPNLTAVDAASAYFAAAVDALPSELRNRAGPPIILLGSDARRELFDERARKLMNISGEEFSRRWDAGEFDDVANDEDHPEVGELAALRSLGR